MWSVDSSCLPELDPDDDAYSTSVAVLNDAKEVAIQVLWALSGRQFGVYSATVRPCPVTYGRRVYEPYLLDGDRYSVWGCGCDSSCTRSGPSAVHLPGPVVSIDAVTFPDGDLPSDDYVLEDDVLYRVGGAWWPTQNMGRPLGETGTWSVAYQCGVPPPAGTAKMVGLLATEFYNACTGGKCRLPRSVTEMTRQGVSHRIVNPQEIYASGKTGIPEIDLWLSSVNPNHLMCAPEVL